MSRKPVPAQTGDRSRLEVTFDRPQLLSALFGHYDQNLVALENRLGVYITARGNRVGLEGSAEQVALARDVLNDLYKRIQRGEEIDTGLVDASIAMAELSLLPAVRGADPQTLVVADGTSCRHQISDGTGREALHVARVLAMSLARTRTDPPPDDGSSFRGARSANSESVAKAASLDSGSAP